MFVPSTIRNIPHDVLAWFDDLKHRENECFAILCLDKDMNVLSKKIVANGDENGTNGTRRNVWAEILSNSNCDRFYLVHNHPNGLCYSSGIDDEMTKDMLKVAKVLRMTLLDHIIITKDSYYSYKEHKYIIK